MPYLKHQRVALYLKVKRIPVYCSVYCILFSTLYLRQRRQVITAGAALASISVKELVLLDNFT
jgi:hypothetical protein